MLLNAVICRLVGHQPTPVVRRRSRSRNGNALPRTSPAMSLQQAMISGSRGIGSSRPG